MLDKTEASSGDHTATRRFGLNNDGLGCLGFKHGACFNGLEERLFARVLVLGDRRATVHVAPHRILVV
jgi:hypothetical protein